VKETIFQMGKQQYNTLYRNCYMWAGVCCLNVWQNSSLYNRQRKEGVIRR